MGFRNKSARPNTTPTPASSGADTEAGRSSARIQRELTRSTSSEAPKGKKIKTTKAVS